MGMQLWTSREMYASSHSRSDDASVVFGSLRPPMAAWTMGLRTSWSGGTLLKRSHRQKHAIIAAPLSERVASGSVERAVKHWWRKLSTASAERFAEATSGCSTSLPRKVASRPTRSASSPSSVRSSRRTGTVSEEAPSVVQTSCTMSTGRSVWSNCPAYAANARQSCLRTTLGPLRNLWMCAMSDPPSASRAGASSCSTRSGPMLFDFSELAAKK
mmetsp:Transcript_26527/g.63387  ORF Transcript_26527/g.63387 Transcript_26527/m.63387 type:complete len:215 (-) Transcript_26527:287-931(-)